MFILLVEDQATDMRIVNAVVQSIPDVKELTQATTYTQALQCLESHFYNVVLADIKLNDTHDGIDLCRHIRRCYPQTIIILITGYDKTERLRASYDSGCYDYVRKPYSRLELGKKIQTWFELMMCKHSETRRLEYQGLLYDFAKNTFYYNEEPLKLSKSCKHLLQLLIATPESLVSRENIYRQLWGDHDTSLRRRNIGERILKLRRQLPKEVAAWIQSIVGEGYVLKR